MPRAKPPTSPAYTLVETLVTLVILAILATVAMEAVANTDAGLRAERAAREAVSALRFARMRAMSDGVSYKVRFSVAAQTISVIDPNNGNALLAAPLPGGTFVISLAGTSSIANVTMTPALAGAAADPYDLTYTSMGGTPNTGTITFTYGVSTKVLQIPNVGDPILVGDNRRP